MKIKHRKAFICGIKGTKISKKEFKFLKKYKPWGIILFSRNIKSIKQVQNLTHSIKTLFNNYNFPILIDEEGGRVSPKLLLVHPSELIFHRDEPLQLQQFRW